MADLLLDTHTLLWALTEPTRLGRRARRAVEDRRSTIYVSAVSGLELATKHRLGKLPHAWPVLEGFERHRDRLGAEELSITTSHALLAGSLEWDHRDPFDRLLAAQSLVEGVPLVTKDAAFTTIPGFRVLW